MVPKRSNARERKDKILGIVVHEYIKNISPVGSSHLVDQYDLDVSSATVRNTLAELEQDGYLSHPHTSAGRVPTQKGYRYYVDFLMREISLLEEERLRLQYEYRKGINELDRILENTGIVLSDLTHYTSIISFDDWGNKIICRGTNYIVEYPDSPNMQKVSAILKELEEKERVLEVINRDLRQKVDIYIGQEMAMKNMEDCSMAISRFQNKEGRQGRIAVLGPTRMDYQRVVSALEYVTQMINRLM